jgi:hypothetical protein
VQDAPVMNRETSGSQSQPNRQDLSRPALLLADEALRPA